MSTQFPTAVIQVTIKIFKPTSSLVSVSSSDEAEVILVNGIEGVISQAEPNAPIVVAKGKAVDLVFLVASIDGHNYCPIGIGFIGSAGHIGMQDFPTRTVATAGSYTMKLTVHDANVGEGAFDFKLVIQQISAEGLLGVVDPQIRNG